MPIGVCRALRKLPAPSIGYLHHLTEDAWQEGEAGSETEVEMGLDSAYSRLIVEIHCLARVWQEVTLVQTVRSPVSYVVNVGLASCMDLSVEDPRMHTEEASRGPPSPRHQRGESLKETGEVPQREIERIS